MFQQLLVTRVALAKHAVRCSYAPGNPVSAGEEGALGILDASGNPGCGITGFAVIGALLLLAGPRHPSPSLWLKLALVGTLRGSALKPFAPRLIGVSGLLCCERLLATSAIFPAAKLAALLQGANSWPAFS